MSYIEVSHSYKRYKMGETEIVANRDVSFSIEKGELAIILGSSGAGKSTMLNILGGMDTNDEGSVIVDGKDISNYTPRQLTAYRRSDVGFVFQFYNLVQNLTAKENVELATEIVKNALDPEQVLIDVGLEKRINNFPAQLSGGEQQRVAIARALVNEPELLLLDEPLGALDLKFRKEMQLELKRMQKQLGITFVYVTHDQEEALSMSDTIAVMDSGRIQQIGTPVMIYNEPVNSFVADFIGESNILYGIMKEDYVAHFAGRDFRCLDRGYNNNEPVVVVVRPEDIKLVPPTDQTVNGVVTSIIFMGVHYEIRLKGDDGFEWLIQSIHSAEVGSRLGIHLDPDDIHIMDRSQYDTAESLEIKQ